MAQGFLSDIELYYTEPSNVRGKNLVITGEEVKHIVKVMRHTPGDSLYVTDGEGHIFECELSATSKDTVKADILETHSYANALSNIIFCLPRLKSQDRFEFALEKCIELGITRFIVFQSERCVAKGEKLARWNKVALAAMKQSLRSFLPEINYVSNFQSLLNNEGPKIIFSQNAQASLQEYLHALKQSTFNKQQTMYFIFGPEGGLSESEVEAAVEAELLKLTGNRLRSETAIVAAATEISLNL